MKIILHGTLAEKFGREFTIATKVPAEAIEGLSRQLPEWPRDLVIDCVGYDTEDKLRAETEVDEIHLTPRMYGGGGKFTKIIIGAALIGLAIATGGIALPLIGTISAGTMFMMGAALMLSGVSELFLKAPTINNGGVADPPASKYLGIHTNTVAIGTLMTMAWGKMKLAGHWLSLQSDSSDLVTTSFPTTTS